MPQATIKQMTNWVVIAAMRIDSIAIGHGQDQCYRAQIVLFHIRMVCNSTVLYVGEHVCDAVTLKTPVISGINAYKV
jgi:hypothetical protein